MTDELKDRPTSQEPIVAGENDLLYGWLVGRAAADLGLAQALALSESRSNDRLKRLEENLLAQVRELQNSPNSNRNSADDDGRLAALEAEMERFTTRQQHLEAEQIDSDKLEALVRARLCEFENQIRAQAQSKGDNLSDFKFELTLLADRIARAEFSARQAQALASSENHRMDEQIVRLVQPEMSKLKAQIVEELQCQQTSPSAVQTVEAALQKRIDRLRDEFGQANRVSDDVGMLQTELEGMARRMSQIESAGSSAIAFDDRWQSWKDQSEQQLNFRLNALSEGIEEKLNAFSAASGERDSQAAALAACFERLGRLEQAARMGMADLKAEICAVKTRLDEPVRKAPSDESSVARVEQSLSARIGDLENQLSLALKTNESHDAEFRGVSSQITNLGEKLSRLADRADDRTGQHMEQSDWQKQVEQLISARTRELESLLHEEGKRWENSAADSDRFKAELDSALTRLAQIELANEQAHTSAVNQAQRSEQHANELSAEVAALKTGLSRQSDEQVQAAIQRLQDNFATKINELQGFLANQQHDQRSGQALISELRDELQLITQRLLQTETSAQQTHALMVNQTEQAAQLRNGLMQELATVQSQFAERQARDAHIDRETANLSARIDEIKSQLSQKWQTLAERDGDIAEVKSQMQILAQQLAVKSAAPLTIGRLHGPVGVVVGPTSVKAPSDDASILTPAPEVYEASPVIKSYVADADTHKDQKKQLQQRLSADIERVRAELRKRAGVSH